MQGISESRQEKFELRTNVLTCVQRSGSVGESANTVLMFGRADGGRISPRTSHSPCLYETRCSPWQICGMSGRS